MYKILDHFKQNVPLKANAINNKKNIHYPYEPIKQ